MDRRERAGGLLTGIMAALEGHQSTLMTALPGIIQSFNPSQQTCVVKAAIKFKIEDSDGSSQWVDLPPLVDCPVFFASGGGVTLTFPVSAGDECLVVFASRCIDSWWQLGGSQVPAEIRMHDLSDGMVFPGFKSTPNVITSINPTKAQLRTNAGTTLVEIDPGSGDIKIQSTSKVTLTAPVIDLNGTVNINGVPYMSHTHLTPAGGPAITGPVI